MAKNIQSLQLLRNTSELYATREAALAVLTGSTPAGTQDGSPVLARYKGADGKIYTLVGFYAKASGITSDTVTGTDNMTVFDYEGSAAGAKKYADNKVAEELSKLTATTVAGDSKIVSDVTQANGKITATSKNLTAVKLEGLSTTADTKIAATDTLGDALAKLQGQIDKMDKAAEAVDGQVVTTVTEADGKVTETKANVKDLQLGGYAKVASATGDIASADTINVALSKLENKAAAITIKNDDGSINVTTGANGTNINVNISSTEKVIKKDGNGGLYTDLDLVKITNGLPTAIKERYQLLASDNSQIGVNIDIAKDSHIVSIRYISDTGDTHCQNLEYKYIDANGAEKTEYVDISSLVLEAEFDSGITVTNHIAHGVVDPTSEKNSGGTAFLTVGKDGFKVDGIKQEIINRINELDATVGEASVATDKHVAVQVVEEDGKITAVTVKENNIADADDLATLSGKTVTEIASSNGSITATKSEATDGTSKYDIITDASKIKMTGFTSTSVLSGINATSFVTEAFEEVDKVITDNEQIVSAALNDLKAAKIDVIKVNGKQSKTPASGDVLASVTINGADIKLDGYASGSTSTAVLPTDTVNQAIGKLENQVKAAVDGGLQAVESGNGISVSAVANNKQTISVKLKAAETGWENPLKFDSNGGLYFDSLDCGTY